MLYGAVVSVPTTLPPSNRVTFEMPLSSLALIVTTVDPTGSVAPSDGETNDTVGSASLGGVLLALPTLTVWILAGSQLSATMSSVSTIAMSLPDPQLTRSANPSSA